MVMYGKANTDYTSHWVLFYEPINEYTIPIEIKTIEQ